MPVNYTPEQRAILARLSDISARFKTTVAAQQAAQAATASQLIGAVERLTAAIDRSNELQPLFTQYIDAFHEFLDSL